MLHVRNVHCTCLACLIKLPIMPCSLHGQCNLTASGSSRWGCPPGTQGHTRHTPRVVSACFVPLPCIP